MRGGKYQKSVSFFEKNKSLKSRQLSGRTTDERQQMPENDDNIEKDLNCSVHVIFGRYFVLFTADNHLNVDREILQFSEMRVLVKENN